MVEIVFSESACGSLKIAQTYGRGKYRGSAISVFIRHENGSVPSSNEMKEAQLQAQEQECIAWENAIPLGGKSSDAVSYTHLDVYKRQARKLGDDFDKTAVLALLTQNAYRAAEQTTAIPKYPHTQKGRLREEKAKKTTPADNTLQRMVDREVMDIPCRPEPVSYTHLDVYKRQDNALYFICRSVQI